MHCNKAGGFALLGVHCVNGGGCIGVGRLEIHSAAVAVGCGGEARLQP
jgi:hypothetical protein